jgi:hypothetical protein
MKRFFGKVGRFFWSWGFLKFVLWTVTLVVLFYVEEDWRGARAWAATKAKWEAKGETFDYAKFIPPAVPDNENLGAVPLFQMTQREWSPGKFTPDATALEKATRENENWNSGDLPPLGRINSGEPPDMAKIRTYLAAGFAHEFKGQAAPADPVAQLDALFPFVEELRAASATRPFCRFNEDYLCNPPDARALSPLTKLIRVSRLISMQALLCLDAHRPDAALADLKLNQKLALGAARDPTLVGGLVGMGMITIGGSALNYGLAQHEWSDPQLAELEEMLGQVDFLAMYQFAFRAEMAGCVLDIDYYRHMPIREIRGLFQQPDRAPGEPEIVFDWLGPWPGGWWDSNKCLMADCLLTQQTVIDSKARRIFPERADALRREVMADERRWDAAAPWRIWYTVAAGPYQGSIFQFSFVQARTDMARIACALERYRLAKGSYPATLAELVPAYIDAVPHDIMNGEPYHYRVNGDGTFTLYSVGWNEIDDGGKMFFKKDSPSSSSSIDYEKGDWVWPTPKG